MIPYHGTPCGATRPDVVRFLAGRHALIPYPRREDIGAVIDVCQSFCLDNGAFTAWKSGNPIRSWADYYQWSIKLSAHPAFDFAIIPDVIDGDENANDALIAEWNATVYRREIGAPVWHLHESLDRLDALCRQWPRVCLGSSGSYRSPGSAKWKRRMAEVMGVACDSDGRPRCKLHGLRMLDPRIVERYPLASADSTNAVRNSSSLKRFGMYTPPTASQRMEVIASRIEAIQSPSVWIPPKHRQRTIVDNATLATWIRE